MDKQSRQQMRREKHKPTAAYTHNLWQGTL